MNDNLRESLSALADDEATELELARILANSDDEALRSTWSRYQLASMACRGEPLGHVPVPADFADSVSAALVEEGGAQQKSSRFQSMLRPLTSFAVAASVASIVVIGGQQIGGLSNDVDAGNAQPSLAANISPVGLVNTLGAMPVNASYGTQPLPNQRQQLAQQAGRDLAARQLQRHLPAHAQQAALNSSQGLVPYARAYSIGQ